MFSISLRFVLSGFIAIVTVICTVVPFVPTYQVGIESVQTTIDDVRAGILNQLLSSVDGFFAAPQQAVSIVQVMQKSAQTNFETEGTQTLMSLACEVMTSNPDRSFKTAFFLMPEVTSVTDVGASTGRYIHCDSRFGPARAGFANATQFYLFHTVTNAPSSPYKYSALGGIHGRPYLKLGLTAKLLAKKEVYQRADANASLRWSYPYPGYNSFQLSAFFSWRDSNGHTCLFTLDVLPQAVSDFLMTAGLRSRGRALIAHPEKKVVIGNSWNETNVVLKSKWADLTAMDNERMLGKSLTDYNDTLMNQVIAHLGGADAVYAIPPKSKFVMGSGQDKVYIDVDRFKDDFGLDLLILVAMPEIDFLESVYDTRQKIIIIVVVVAVVMVVLSMAFSIFMTTPIQRIGDRMYATASLQDNGEDERNSLSILAEVADIQIAYELMKQELNRMKAFLPASVLATMYSENDDEDATDDEGDFSRQNSAAQSESSASNTFAHNKRSHHPSETSSVASSHIHRGPGAGHHNSHGLNTRGTLSEKRIAVMVINLSDFHDAVRGTHPTNVSTIQAELLKVATKHIRENRGVVDSFQGDHVVATFNAVHVAQAYCRRATTAAYEICADIRNNTRMPLARAGVSVGKAFVGNSGIPELQRFNIIGEVFNEAWKCQQICSAKYKKLYARSAAVVISQPVVVDVETEFYCQHVDFAKSSGKKMVLSSVVCYADPTKRSRRNTKCELQQKQQSSGTHSAQNSLTSPRLEVNSADFVTRITKSPLPDHLQPSGATTSHGAVADEDCEWMYRLDQNSVNDPFRQWNELFMELTLRDHCPTLAALKQKMNALEGVSENTASSYSKPLVTLSGGDAETPNKALLMFLREILEAYDNNPQRLVEEYDAFKDL